LHLAQFELPSEEVSQVLQGHLSAWTGKKVSAINVSQLSNLMSEINQAQSNDRERIDSYYLENLEISEVMSTLEEKIAWYKSIGLFLQIFGLALILARDLARKP
ncbi:DNA mismatch repair protein, partial [Vibrio rotiferianus]